jgi:DNA-binding winged helix-turn-helix (wHTH) protein
MLSPQSMGVLQFGPFRIDREQRLLTIGNAVIALAPKVFDTLLALVESGGRVVDKDTLLQKVWPDAFVEEGSLPRNISTLRKALGEGPHDQKYIATIPKRGYRFVAAVTTASTAAAGGDSEAAFAAPHNFVGRQREMHRLASWASRTNACWFGKGLVPDGRGGHR